MPRPPLPPPTSGRREGSAADPVTWTNVLAEVPLFAGLGRRQLRKVAGTGRIGRFHDAMAIVRAGEPGDTFYVVIDGQVSVSRRGFKTVTLGFGSFFGELALLLGGERSATVTAKGPVLCLVITRARFRKLLRDEPAIAIGVLEEVGKRLLAVEASI